MNDFKYANLDPQTEYWIQKFCMYSFEDYCQCQFHEVKEKLADCRKDFPNSFIRVIERKLVWTEKEIIAGHF